MFVEYVMLDGVNDSYAQARQLAEALDPRIFKVNLIPYNPTDSPYRGSSPKAIDAFRAELERHGIGATVRLTRGREIDAACGQLAATTPEATSPADRVLAARLTAQLLAGRPARDPVTVTERLLAVQAQDPRGARLAIRARTRGLRAADVDRELTERRSLLITWLNRGTLHLVRAEDYGWLHAVTTPPLRTTCDTRLRQNGLSASQVDKGCR